MVVFLDVNGQRYIIGMAGICIFIDVECYKIGFVPAR